MGVAEWVASTPQERCFRKRKLREENRIFGCVRWTHLISAGDKGQGVTLKSHGWSAIEDNHREKSSMEECAYWGDCPYRVLLPTNMIALHELQNDTPFPVALSSSTRICQNIFAGTLMDLYSCLLLGRTRMTEVREEGDTVGTQAGSDQRGMSRVRWLTARVGGSSVKTSGVNFSVQKRLGSQLFEVSEVRVQKV